MAFHVVDELLVQAKKCVEQLIESGEEICEVPYEPGGIFITTNPNLVIALNSIEKDGINYFIGLPRDNDS